MSNHGFDIIGISSPGEALRDAEVNEGVRTIAIPMTRTISPLQDLLSLWKLYRILKKEQPLIVHTHTPKAGTVGMIASKLANIPYRLHTIAGLPLLEAKGAKRILLDCVEKITYMCATKIYPNSFVLKDIILKNGYTSTQKVRVIGNGSSNGIDTSFFSRQNVSENTAQEIKTRLGISSEDTVFTFVGRIVRDKGINELVGAFVQLCTNYPEAKLLLVGTFERELDPLETLTEERINEHSAIISVGFQTDVRPYLAISDIFVFPSYREGFPNVVMQAGAMGLPCIVTDINGCNEIIEQGVNGVIIPPKDTNALYQAMELLLTNTVVRNQMAGNARKMIADRYEQQYVWSELLKEYRSLC